jgi:hypothetical protein
MLSGLLVSGVLALAACGGGGGDEESGDPNKIVYPSAMEVIPSYLETFSTDDEAKQRLHDLLLTMSVYFDSPATLAFYNEIVAGDVSPKEAVESGCTIEKDFFTVAYIDIICGDFNYNIEYHDDGSLRLWYFDYSRSNGFTRTKAFISGNSVSYESDYIVQGGADIVFEAIFIYDGANFYTDVVAEYID